MNNWLSSKVAAQRITMSRDTIERRGIPWCEDFIPGKIRYKELELGEGTRQPRRYYEPDVEALLVTPKAMERLGARSLIPSPSVN